jgi:hypothetical protein
MEAASMPTIVDFPTIVQEALTVFGEVFDTEAARRHFAEYLTGLIVAERKTVNGINREFVDCTFDSYFTSAKVLHHIQKKQRAYVGDLKLNRKVVYAGQEQKLQVEHWSVPEIKAVLAKS